MYNDFLMFLVQRIPEICILSFGVGTLSSLCGCYWLSDSHHHLSLHFSGKPGLGQFPSVFIERKTAVDK